MSSRNEPREINPLQLNWDGTKGLRDFGPRVQRVTDEEREEMYAEAPKGSSVQEPVVSPPVESPVTPGSPTSPPSPESHVQLDGLTPTEKLEAAVAASGKDSEQNADEPPTPTTQTPPPASSKPSSSSEMSRGSSVPPVSAPLPPAPPSSPPTPPQT